MGHPAIDEFCRINSLGNFRPETFRRMQRIFRDEINPQLDDRERTRKQIDALAGVLLDEFGGPTQDEGACEMAVRLLRTQQADLRKQAGQVGDLEMKEARASAKGKTPHSA